MYRTFMLLPLVYVKCAMSQICILLSLSLLTGEPTSRMDNILVREGLQVSLQRFAAVKTAVGVKSAVM